MNIEEVASASGHGLRWFQLFLLKDRNLTLELIQRAADAGYKALVVTIDTPDVGKRLIDTRIRFHLPPHLTQVNYSNNRTSPNGPPDEQGSSLHRFTSSLLDPSVTWKDIHWLKSVTTLPIVVKGVLTVEDALLAVRHGVNGIIVSNHGGRQLDGSPATVSSLALRALNMNTLV